MFEAQDYTNQKRLGDFTLSKKENALDRGGLLYDATKVMQMTQKFLHKNLTDILRSRKVKETYTQKDQGDLRAQQERFKRDDPDAKYPAYLQDRRKELYNPLRDNRMTFTDRMVVGKMKRFGKWKEERDAYDRDGNGLLRKMDSLVESVYNSEKNLEWLAECGKADRDPHPSEESDRDFDLFGSSDEDLGHEKASKGQTPSKTNQTVPGAAGPPETSSKNAGALEQTPGTFDTKLDSLSGTPNLSAGGSIFVQDPILIP